MRGAQALALPSKVVLCLAAMVPAAAAAPVNSLHHHQPELALEPAKASVSTAAAELNRTDVASIALTALKSPATVSAAQDTPSVVEDAWGLAEKSTTCTGNQGNNIQHWAHYGTLLAAQQWCTTEARCVGLIRLSPLGHAATNYYQRCLIVETVRVRVRVEHAPSPRVETA